MRNVSIIFHLASKFLAPKLTFRIKKIFFSFSSQPCGAMSLNSRSVCNTFLMYVLRFLLNCVASYWALSSLKSEIKGTIICLQMLQWHLQEFKCHQSQDILPQMHSSFLLTPFRGIPFLGCWLSGESECGILKTTSWWLVWASRSTVFGWRLLSWCW